MSEAVHKEKNVLGGELLACSYAPLTAYFRVGCCSTHGEDGVTHLGCGGILLRAPKKRGQPRDTLGDRYGNGFCLTLL